MVLSKIDMVRFAEDFDILCQIEKSNFLDQAYIQQHPVDFRGLGQRARKHMLDVDHMVVNAWKKQVGRVTTARNRLHALFLQVNNFVYLAIRFGLTWFIQYGAMIILDPVWNTKTLLNHQGHELHMVLMSLLSKLVGLHSTDPPDSPHPLAILQPSMEHALVCIVEALAGIAAATYVNEFLNEYALQMCIPCDPRYD
jgi:hypothetical protein